MADHKRQHYVPRCHLRPFSNRREGIAINLFNIPRERCIPRAAVKGQRTKDYPHGEDLEFERHLQRIAELYGRLVAKADRPGYEFQKSDLDLLRAFSYPRYSRTDMANELQYFTAAENRYFPQWEERQKMVEEFDRAKGRRQTTWSTIRSSFPAAQMNTFSIAGEPLKKSEKPHENPCWPCPIFTQDP